MVGFSLLANKLMSEILLKLPLFPFSIHEAEYWDSSKSGKMSNLIIHSFGSNFRNTDKTGLVPI